MKRNAAEGYPQVWVSPDISDDIVRDLLYRIVRMLALLATQYDENVCVNFTDLG